MIRHLGASVPSQGLIQLSGESLGMLREGRRHGFSILLFYFGQHDIPRLAFDSRRNIAVVGSANEISFPMTGYGTIFYRGWPVTNRDGIRDFPKSLSLQTRMLRSADGSFGSETVLQLLFQDASRLNIQAAIDGFVGHACLFAIRVCSFQPPGDLLRGPLLVELGRNDFR
jgi:hypothetical protein